MPTSRTIPSQSSPKNWKLAAPRLNLLRRNLGNALAGNPSETADDQIVLIGREIQDRRFVESWHEYQFSDSDSHSHACRGATNGRKESCSAIPCCLRAGIV